MRLLAIGRLVEGMKVAKPVVHDSGRILLAPGVSMTGRMIERLADQGVAQVWVEAEGPDEGTLSAETAKRMEWVLERRFAHVQHDPLMQQIQAIVRKRIRSRAGGEAFR
jgi:CRISPR/Cas system-associated endonuclease Cas1